MKIIQTSEGDFIVASEYSINKLLVRKLIKKVPGVDAYTTQEDKKYILDLINVMNEYKNPWE